MNFALKRHKKFTDNLAKQNLRSRENEEIPSRDKFY